jgi:protein LTV1
MGKKGKKFIEKGDGQHFYLMHRSQTDGAYAVEERPSDFVLVNADQTNALRQAVVKDPVSAARAGGEQKDHFDELGFRNDGYDYSKHLKEMGGGRFIGVGGQSRDLPAPSILALPASALPSATELDRALQTITIDPELMDPDLRAALFDEDDGGEDFEELQDDFISQCLSAPEVVDFDYNAHIANLIAISEQKNLDTVGARGWGEGETAGLKGFSKAALQKCGVRFHGDMDEDDESGEVESYCSGDGGGKEGGEKAALDDLFERTLEEYDSDDIGDLGEEAEDGRIQGMLDVNEEGTLLDEALNEFVQEKNDIELTEGIKLSEIERNNKGARFIPGDLEGQEGMNATELAARVKEMKIDAAVDMPEEVNDPNDVKDAMQSQPYLAEEREEEQWDCETILTTYSTLDNHPSLINDGNMSKTKKRRERGERKPRADKAAAGAAAAAAATITEVATAKGNTKIILAGKLGLPKVVVVGRTPKAEPIVEEEEEGSDSDSDESREWEERGEKERTGRKAETAEEKKARKQQVKDERRASRSTKKQVKQAFLSERQQQAGTVGRKQDIDGVSVFRYT